MNRNIFAEIGLSEEVIKQRVQDTARTIFYGSDDERFYHPVGEDMGYLTDTGNDDVEQKVCLTE